LQDEYRADPIYEPSSVYTARWVESDDAKKLAEFRRKHAENLALDSGGHLAYLAPSRINLQLTQERWPEIRFLSAREH
jgi:peptide chain release factor 3